MTTRPCHFDGSLRHALERLEEFERAVARRARYEMTPERDCEGLNRMAEEYDQALARIAEVLRQSCQ